MNKYSKEAFIKNGMDVANALGLGNSGLVRQIISGAVAYAMTAVVDYLNSNGHELAAQALDDLWYDREDQWWRQNPDGYDKRYLTGDELFEARG